MKRTALVLLALALSACQPAPAVPTTPTLAAPTAPAPTTPTSAAPSTVLVGFGDGIVLSVKGTETTAWASDATCASVVHRLDTADGAYQALLVLPGCAWNDIPENGRHGYYPTAPPKATVARVDTPLGEAIVFSNQYSECTSSCYIGTDEVALATVDGHVLQVIAVTAPASGTANWATSISGTLGIR